MLGYLAVTRRPQRRDFLIDLLWPDSLPDAARKNLRNTIWTIRKSLGDEVLKTGADWVVLAEGVWSDVEVFEGALAPAAGGDPPAVEQFQAAIDLYRAPLLDGLALADAPEFEIWLAGERERFGQLYLRGLEALAAAHRRAADWPAVIAVARQALAHDNLQEPMYRTLMEAHARLGERPEALRQYETLEAVLARELGVAPLPETQALRRAILDGDLRPPAADAAPAGPPPRPRRAPESPPFVGRQAERRILDETLAQVTAGQARVLLLTGELGIGKTSLWQAWAAALPPALTVLETRCLDTTQSLPFAPLITLFRRRGCFDRLFRPPSPVPPVWLADLARLLPELGNHWPDLPTPAPLPPEEERRRRFEAFVQTLLALPSRPLVLFIDDLHWADRATLDWLVYLIERLHDEPLLLVGAYRSEDAPARLVQLAAAWTRDGVARQLPLSRLTLAETTELVAALGLPGDQAERLQAKSAGNPYFLFELSRATGTGTPPALADLLRARLLNLPDTARQVLQAAAVLETDFDFATVRRTSGRGEEETLDALDALLGASVLAEREGRYEFVHPLVAAVVREDLGLARRSFLHRRAAAALEAIHAGRLSSIAGQLALHYRQAGRPELAAHYAELAAVHALELAAPAEAVGFFRQALAQEPTPARRLGLGLALLAQGALEEARQANRQALAEFEAQGDRACAARASLALADSYVLSGRGDLVVHWAERAWPGDEVQLDPETQSRYHHLLATGGLLTGMDPAEAEEHLRQAARLAAEDNLSQMAARSRFELGNLLAHRGDLEAALRAYEQTIDLAVQAGDHFQEVLGHNNLAYHTMLAGDLATARRHIETGLALADSYSLFLPRQYLFSTRGEIALAEGDAGAAESWLRRALAEARKNGNVVQAANIQANLGLAARARGDLDEALVLLVAAQEALAGLTAPQLEIQLDLWLAELHLQRGERAAAEEALARAEERLAGGERRGLLAWAARVRAALGD